MDSSSDEVLVRSFAMRQIEEHIPKRHKVSGRVAYRKLGWWSSAYLASFRAIGRKLRGQMQSTRVGRRDRTETRAEWRHDPSALR